MGRNFVFPFPAVEGQDPVKKALLWNTVNPLIGGVLISGEKGTAKSTLVRGMAALLPGMKVVELPLNVTEDRLVGTLDLEKAIKEGKKVFEPGILQKAHGNILYVDEVNLLSDNIVNCLLEVSASGVNKVEREGISFSHPARFILIGTMNPEEGMLRPQFIDRFGLYVEVKGLEDLNLRVDVIKRRLKYERDPAAYVGQWLEKAVEIKEQIALARDKVDLVQVSENAVRLAARIAEKENCAGHRAELAVLETAKAIAALCGRTYLTVKDIEEAAGFALPHRVRQKSSASVCLPEQDPQDDGTDAGQREKDTESPEEGRDQPNSEQQENHNQGRDMDRGGDSSTRNSEPDSGENNHEESAAAGENDDDIQEPGEIFIIKPLEIKPVDRRKRRGSGKRSKTITGPEHGRYVRYTFPRGKLRDIAFDATIRAAALFQRERGKNGLALAIRNSDVREKVRERRTGSTILFIVDASGSMGANQRMKAVKGAVLSLLNDVYQKRDKVGMLAFRKNTAELLLGVTRSVDLAQKKLRDLPTGGKTPLAAGLCLGYELIKAVMLKDPDAIPFIVVVSDGRANVPLTGGDPVDDALRAARKIAAEGIKSLVIDTERDYIKLGLARKIAEAMKADYQKLDELEAGRIACSVKGLVR
ncbi:magnesium chelatase subunit D family protein [Pelotomaculum propionicicum]|uniref:Magnesium-chelatase 38 kDa subunit n=1 Tax=Pelotomaculum propionicicum TaxID=258475 RepID=A0A4Y7RNU7_9FIRM|nr:magnesium chelatase subunit D family protein [Pelotomaculum propionicicum]TEB10409.1 Magnesium-chelatase 38 kDa subunit [Pelotomaculum propionicicum]